jgi:hypothetical protein
MLTKCKICGKTPPEEFKQTEPSEDGSPYGKIIDENLYFFIINGKRSLSVPHNVQPVILRNHQSRSDVKHTS